MRDLFSVMFSIHKHLLKPPQEVFKKWNGPCTPWRDCDSVHFQRGKWDPALLPCCAQRPDGVFGSVHCLSPWAATGRWKSLPLRGKMRTGSEEPLWLLKDPPGWRMRQVHVWVEQKTVFQQHAITSNWKVHLIPLSHKGREREVHITAPYQKAESPPSNPVEHLNWEVPTLVAALSFWGAANPAHMQTELDMLTYTCRHIHEECQTLILFSWDKIPV